MASLLSRIGDLITAIGADMKLKAPLASPTFTGTVTTPRLVTPPVTLTDAATVATNAALGHRFRVALGGNRTLGAPTNPVDGQACTWELYAGAATRTVTLASGAGGFAFGTDLTAITPVGAGYIDILGAIYRADVSRWLVVSYLKGF